MPARIIRAGMCSRKYRLYIVLRIYALTIQSHGQVQMSDLIYLAQGCVAHRAYHIAHSYCIAN